MSSQQPRVHIRDHITLEYTHCYRRISPTLHTTFNMGEATCQICIADNYPGNGTLRCRNCGKPYRDHPTVQACTGVVA